MEQIGAERVRLGAAVKTICQVTTPSAQGWHRDNEHFSTSGASDKFHSFKWDTIQIPRHGSCSVLFSFFLLFLVCFALPLPFHFCIMHCYMLKCLSWLKYLDNLNQIHSIRLFAFENWWHKIFWKPHVRGLGYNIALTHREVKSISHLNGVTSTCLSRKFYSPPLFIKMNSLTTISVRATVWHENWAPYSIWELWEHWAVVLMWVT